MRDYRKILSGGDLRSKGKSEEVIKLINNQETFDELYNCLFDADRLVVLRAADAIEKITIENPAFIIPHKNALLELFYNAEHKELKWHMAQIVSRLKLSKTQFGKVWQVLAKRASDKKESRIVRVLSLQAMYDLLKQFPELKPDFDQLIEEVSTQKIPSITARIKQFR
ncbi:MAG: hypothetical protein ACXWW0_01935 [Bacteroidia bacterium]